MFLWGFHDSSCKAGFFIDNCFRFTLYWSSFFFSTFCNLAEGPLNTEYQQQWNFSLYFLTSICKQFISSWWWCWGVSVRAVLSLAVRRAAFPFQHSHFWSAARGWVKLIMKWKSSHCVSSIWVSKDYEPVTQASSWFKMKQKFLNLLNEGTN